jgi:amidohydrolase
VSAVDVVQLRRDLHAHPELAFAETRTTARIVAELRALGLSPAVLAAGTGVVCDIGDDGPTVALRADIDALPIQDIKDVPYRSVIDGVCHGCGHDAHTAILLGAAAELVSARLPGRVRLIFQPGEEVVPGGALSVLDGGHLDDVAQIFALHCDPRLATGSIGLRTGAITAACDHVEVLLSGPGGHTARPHLTVDLVQAVGLVITQLSGLLAGRIDLHAGLCLVWGAVDAGSAANAIPRTARLRGTVRMLDAAAWQGMENHVRELVAEIVAPTGAEVEVRYTQGVPPVVNDAAAVLVQHAAAAVALGEAAITETEQSMGGEDFAWYLGSVSRRSSAVGALARLGVRRPGAEPFDLHQAAFDIDESALDVGVRYTVALARTALARR